VLGEVSASAAQALAAVWAAPLRMCHSLPLPRLSDANVSVHVVGIALGIQRMGPQDVVAWSFDRDREAVGSYDPLDIGVACPGQDPGAAGSEEYGSGVARTLKGCECPQC